MYLCIQSDIIYCFMASVASPRLVVLLMMAVDVHAGGEHDMQHSVRLLCGGVSEA